MAVLEHPQDREPPVHVAIIMDGNGRWAMARGQPRSLGHKQGAEAVRRAVRSAGELGIGYLTLFGFSSENWRRPGDEIEALMDRYVAAALDAQAAGFDMVDIKSCHGYLLHEFLGAHRRPGRFGGDFTGRTRLLLTIIERVREACPKLLVGVRLSLFDTVPWQKVGDHGGPCPVGDGLPYDAGFGVDMNDPARMDLAEPLKLLALLRDRGVSAVNLSAGCPYANPHIVRPAAFPPSDGYPPPEDPLVGVWRQIDAARQAKQAVEGLVLVGSGYTYLQEFLPHAAQAVVRQGWIDIVGLGRMVLSYPELPADLLAGRSLVRGRICRTFSDCTTAPRNGLRSGCYPLDAFYKSLEPEASQMKAIKAAVE